MYSRILTAGLIVGIVISRSPAQTPLSTAFTYQGRLKSGGSPADGSFNMVFKLWNDPTLSAPGNQVGVTIAPGSVPVTNGLFTVSLDFPGGIFPASSVFDGNKRWLDITVDGTTLMPRQELTATAYALRSAAPWATSGNHISNTNTGNVGIGTAAPAQRLHLANASGPVAVRLEGFTTLSTSQVRSPTSAASGSWANAQNVFAS